MSDEDLFRSEYRKYRNQLQPERRKVKKLLKPWIRAEKWSQDGRITIPGPIARVDVRIKTRQSAHEKIVRKKEDFPKGPSLDSLQKLTDMLAARLTVRFIQDLPTVHYEILRLEELGVIELLPCDAPIAYLPKEQAEELGLSELRIEKKSSGYNGIHYTIRLTNGTCPWFEWQLRTLAQDMWAQISHDIGYKSKNNKHLPALAQFRTMSRQLGAIDELFGAIWDEVIDFWMTAEFHPEDKLSKENLGLVLAGVGIQCKPADTFKLLKWLRDANKLTVMDVYNLASANLTSADRIKCIRNTLRAKAGLRVSTAREIVRELVSPVGTDASEN